MSKSFRSFAATIFLMALALSGSPLLAIEPSHDEDSEGCQKNLRDIYQAIKAYRAEHKQLPEWLSDLVPKYLKDQNLLVCPAVKKTGQITNYGIEDPKISTSYVYEFSSAPIPKSIYNGPPHSMRDWKRRQMSVVGSRVPIVRCHHHSPLLNLAFDGTIYASAGSWEADLKDEVDPRDLSAARLFSAENASAALAKLQTEIPPRETNASPYLIDLSRHYNAALTEGWHRQGAGDIAANDLAWLPRGLQKFADVDFDVRGIVQLSSKKLTIARYPSEVRNIKVGLKAVRLHFLHGTGWAAPEGTPVATFLIRSANGEVQQHNILYGLHVIDWVAEAGSPKDPKISVTAWTGKSPATGGQKVLHLYKSQWKNPNPEQTIVSIDFLSSNSDPAPFLIAITAEPLQP